MEKTRGIQAGLSDRCVILGGQPRSGTSLLTSMLRTSDALFQAFELHIRKPSFVVGNNRRYTMNIFNQMGMPNDCYQEIIKQYTELVHAMNLGAWAGPKEEVSAESLSGYETDNFAVEFFARAELTGTLMRATARIAGKPRWGFKILGDIIYADRYAAVWPHATFILVVRDPRDHALSIMKLNEPRLQRGQPPFYRDYAAVARGWRETVEVGTRVLRENGLNHIIVRYEDLVQEPELILGELGKKLDINLSKAQEFHNADFIGAHTKRFIHHDNLLKPVNAASVGKWRDRMSSDDVQIFSEIAAPVMRAYGYEV